MLEGAGPITLSSKYLLRLEQIQSKRGIREEKPDYLENPDHLLHQLDVTPGHFSLLFWLKAANSLNNRHGFVYIFFIFL